MCSEQNSAHLAWEKLPGQFVYLQGEHFVIFVSSSPLPPALLPVSKALNVDSAV